MRAQNPRQYLRKAHPRNFLSHQITKVIDRLPFPHRRRFWNSLFDIIDPNRIGYYSVVSGEGGATPGGNLDWSHSNGLYYDSTDHSYLISIRHQDAIAKIGLEDGDLRWIIGDHHGWGDKWKKFLLSPDGYIDWQYHQHDPSITKAGTILCFDNGNCRAVPFNDRMQAKDSYSRVVEYSVDKERNTVGEVWGPFGIIRTISDQFTHFGFWQKFPRVPQLARNKSQVA